MDKIYIYDKNKCYNFLDDFSKITLKQISANTKIDYANVKNKKASEQKVIFFVNSLLTELEKLVKKYK